MVIIRVTPASVARRSTSSRSCAKSGKSRWAWVSISIADCECGSRIVFSDLVFPQSAIRNPQLISPFQYRARPSKPTPENDHQNIITALDPTSTIGFVECDCYSCGGRVAVAIQIHTHLVARNAEPVSDGLHDAQVCLMRNYAGDVFNGKPCLIERFFRCVQHRDDSLFVHFLAGHVYRSQMHVHIVSCDRAP